MVRVWRDPNSFHHLVDYNKFEFLVALDDCLNVFLILIFVSQNIAVKIISVNI